MRKTLFFILTAALISLASVSLFKSMKEQSARVQLMQTLSTQLGSINPAEPNAPCESKALSQTWQQLRQSSAAINGEFAFVLQDLAANDALLALQATLREAPSCSELPKQWRALEASCDQCHRAIRGGNSASPIRRAQGTNAPAGKAQ